MENQVEATMLGLFWDNGKQNGNYSNYTYIGIMEKKMETIILLVLCWVTLG